MTTTDRCGFTVLDADGIEGPCDRPATGHRWYQGHDHEDMLDVACDLHENEGGRRLHAAEGKLADLRAEVERLRARDEDRLADLRQANLWSWEFKERAEAAEARESALREALVERLAEAIESVLHGNRREQEAAARAVLPLVEAHTAAVVEAAVSVVRAEAQAEVERNAVAAEAAIDHANVLRMTAEAEVERLTALVDLYRAEWVGTRPLPDCTCGGVSACLTCQESDSRPDDLPCPNCGGDRLRPNFTGDNGLCHVGGTSYGSNEEIR